jgi:hypothetical protein
MKLEEAHEDHRSHADLPGEDGGVALGHGRFGGDERRTEDGERDANRRGSIRA